jgi:Nif-specific regulatory protein
VPQSTWFRIHLKDQKYSSTRYTLPCLVGGSAKKRDLDSLQTHLSDTQIKTLTHLEMPLTWLASDFGLFVEQEDGLKWLTLGQTISDRIYYIHKDHRVLVENESIDLWGGDLLEIHHRGQVCTLSIESEDLDLDDVVAERSIENVGDYADRVLQSQSRLSQLFKHSLHLGQSQDLNQTLKTAATFIFDLMPRATHVAIALKEEKRTRFPVMYSQHRSGGEVEIPMSRTLIKQVVDRRSSILLMNASEEQGSVQSVLAAGLVSTLCIPLWMGAEICGMIQVDNRDQPGVFGTEDLELLTVASSSISFATASARLIDRLRVAEDQLKGGLNYMQSLERQEASGLIGESESMRLISQSIERVKDLKVPVFINGETGTGKELIARALHYQSNRKDALFVAQNCGALPENLLESELFGHTKGSFTGADRDKKGLFDLADGGTIFLDEVGEMPGSLQAKLLRVLQEGEIWPLGASRPKKVNVRVLSATHCNLQEMVQEGRFRQDLFYRLHVYPIHLPPLRDRGDDIILIAHYFLKRYSHEFGRGVSGFSDESMRALIHHSWPGNVRELQNEIQRALISRFEGDLILIDDISPHISGVDPQMPDVMRETLNVQGTLKEMMEYLEKQLLQRALGDHNNNKTHTAKALGITREGLHKKLNRFSI